MTHTRIHAPNIEISSDTVSQIESTFSHALDRFTHVVREAEITLLDVNGPKGGIDKRCRVQVRLYPRGLVVVRSTGASVLEAANDACDKTRRAIAKKLCKQKTGSKNIHNPLKAIEGGLYAN